jgi:hypothetical protein
MFLILFIIDFALAAPVLVQEKRDVVHIPRDVITELGKRVDEDIEKLLKEYYKTFEKSPSSDPVEPNPSTKHEPAWSPPSVSSIDSSDSENFEWLNEPDEEFHGTQSTPTSEGYNVLNHGAMEAHAPQPNPNPKKRPLTGPDPNLEMDWTYWMNVKDPAPKRPALSEEFDQANWHQVAHAPVQQPDPGLPTNTDFDRINVAHLPSTSTGSYARPPGPELTDPELHLDNPGQSLSTYSPPAESPADSYARKGKAKVE